MELHLKLPAGLSINYHRAGNIESKYFRIEKDDIANVGPCQGRVNFSINMWARWLEMGLMEALHSREIDKIYSFSLTHLSNDKNQGFCSIGCLMHRKDDILN